jgi:hypothetical protein
MKRLIVAAAGLCAAALAAGPHIFYSKEFPGSSPPYMSVDLDPDGAAIYQEAAKDDYPIRFKLDPEEAAEIFRLAEKLDRFKRTLESGLKVANMGIKTFRWEEGATRNEVKFNYSLDADAQALADWFEKIGETEQNLIRLERTVKYERLGVNQSLLQLEMSYDRKRLVGAAQFLPLLDRVAKNESYLHMARERAARLADAIRARKAAKAE